MFFVPAFVFSQGKAPVSEGEMARFVAPFRHYTQISALSVPVPTVVELPFEAAYIERSGVAVYNVTEKTFEPSWVRQEAIEQRIPVVPSVETGIAYRVAAMTDGDSHTYAEFPLTGTPPGSARIVLSADRAVRSSALTFVLDDHVALPLSVEIRAVHSGKETIVVASRSMNTATVRFPETSAQTWIITVTYGQPLRILELHLAQENAAITRTRALRFLAQPEHEYRVYYDPDRSVAIPVGESGNLSIDTDVRMLASIPSQKNPLYTPADTDSDGIPDAQDNCVAFPNTDQKDANENGRGDACDDFDKDGVLNERDNCPDRPNSNQADIDNDGKGDACDPEESRITERLPWLPWVGMGFAAAVLILLCISMLSSQKRE